MGYSEPNLMETSQRYGTTKVEEGEAGGKVGMMHCGIKLTLTGAP